MSHYTDFKKDHQNTFLNGEQYYELVQRNKEYYPEFKQPKNTNDIDTIAFLGLRLDDGIDLSALPPRTIPYGDRIIRSFTVGDYDYYATYTGYFYKKHQSKDIKPIEEKVFWSLIPERGVFNFCPRLGSPQAGLTRGSKRSFSDRAETQKNRFQEIQDKYKDGVK